MPRGRPMGSKNKKGVTLGKLDRKIRESTSTITEEREVDNHCMECENGRKYIFCFRDDDWKEKEVCLKVCSDGGRGRCRSWRLHIENNPIRARKTKNQALREKEK
jgi:hypothetical protein